MKKIRELTKEDLSHYSEHDIDIIAQKTTIANKIIKQIPFIVGNYIKESEKEVNQKDIPKNIKGKVNSISKKIIQLEESKGLKDESNTATFLGKLNSKLNSLGFGVKKDEETEQYKIIKSKEK
tara:strand:+ start:407 stop:775 length:369 start_codon:yes stop_codon:yes gene_type:complete